MSQEREGEKLRPARRERLCLQFWGANTFSLFVQGKWISCTDFSPISEALRTIQQSRTHFLIAILWDCRCSASSLHTNRLRVASEFPVQGGETVTSSSAAVNFIILWQWSHSSTFNRFDCSVRSLFLLKPLQSLLRDALPSGQLGLNRLRWCSGLAHEDHSFLSSAYWALCVIKWLTLGCFREWDCGTV